MKTRSVKDDLLLKKIVLGSTAVLAALWVVSIFFQQDAMEQMAITDSVQQDELRTQRTLNRILNGMRGISQNIQQGAASMDRVVDRQVRQREEDEKMIAARSRQIDRTNRCFRETMYKAMEEDTRHKDLRKPKP